MAAVARALEPDDELAHALQGILFKHAVIEPERISIPLSGFGNLLEELLDFARNGVYNHP